MGNVPPVLLLSDEGPHMSTAGAILLYRLLEDYPADRLRVIERRVDPDQNQLACRYDSLTTPWRRFEGSRFHKWKRSLRAFDLVPQVPLRRIDALLDGFSPEVVLCVMQHACYFDTAHRFARARGLPLMVIVHDVNEQFEPVFPWALAAARRRDGAFYRYASRRLCVSTEMESLCAELYGARGQVMYPNRSEELRPRSFEEARTLKMPGTLTVGFVGNLNYGYGDELLRLLPVLRTAGVRLVAFSNPPGGKCAALLEAKDCFDFRGFAPSMQAWRAIQSECDAVILPYPESPGHLERLYRYHFPSKLPEYLALGMPVIVTGPSYATGVKWGLRNPTAVITSTDADPVAHTGYLERLRSDPSWRVELARGGYEAGLRDFDPQKIKTQFLTYLRTAANGARA
jgi:glycosyltransferase involved in cell wall biosynthesis